MAKSHACMRTARWLSTASAAEILGMSTDFVLYLAHSGEVKARKMGTRVQVDADSLDEYVRKSEEVFDRD